MTPAHLSFAAALALALAACTSPSTESVRDLNEEAQRALGCVSLRVLDARVDAVDQVPVAPLSADSLLLEGEGGPCEIRTRPGPAGLELVLAEHGEERVVATGVRRLSLGEEPNGMDDNGNGLIDEPGFSVVRDRDSVSIRLTLARDHGGEELTAHVETRVTLPR